MKKLRWKKEPKPTGLSAVGAGPYRASTLHDGENEYATCSPAGRGAWNTGDFRGWYWVAFTHVPYKNTHREVVPDEKDAKAAAMAYVKQHLAMKEHADG